MVLVVEVDGNGMTPLCFGGSGFGLPDAYNRIFILEGLVPVTCSFFMWKLLPDSPETATFLEKHEKEFIINRIATETGSGQGHVTNSDKIRMHHIWAGLKEWKVWAMIIVYWGNSVGVYGQVTPKKSTRSRSD